MAGPFSSVKTFSSLLGEKLKEVVVITAESTGAGKTIRKLIRQDFSLCVVLVCVFKCSIYVFFLFSSGSGRMWTLFRSECKIDQTDFTDFSFLSSDLKEKTSRNPKALSTYTYSFS